jgi:chromate transporter
MLLPGPEAQQLATYLGWRLHGIRGGIVAGSLFILPAALLLWLLSLLYVTGQHLPLLMAFFAGLKPAVVAIVISACWRMGKRTLTSLPLALFALIALLLLSFTPISYPLLILGFGLLGVLLSGKIPPFQGGRAFAVEPVPNDWTKVAAPAVAIMALWGIPVAALLLWLGVKSVPVQVALFFAKAAVVSFGGAYAALSYVALHASGDWGWITSSQMMDGLGLAETTPGPLLIALQFVAFVAAYKMPGILSPLAAATLASMAACWSLFLPSFLWIFTLAPFMTRLSNNLRISGALSAIGAVVMAVILHLALWFAGNLFLPKGGFATIPFMIMLASLLALEKKVGMTPVILCCGLLGVLIAFF